MYPLILDDPRVEAVLREDEATEEPPHTLASMYSSASSWILGIPGAEAGAGRPLPGWLMISCERQCSASAVSRPSENLASISQMLDLETSYGQGGLRFLISRLLLLPYSHCPCPC